MILLACLVNDRAGQHGKHVVFCEGCGSTYVLSNWKCRITPEKVCPSCAAKRRHKKAREAADGVRT